MLSPTASSANTHRLVYVEEMYPVIIDSATPISRPPSIAPGIEPMPPTTAAVNALRRCVPGQGKSFEVWLPVVIRSKSRRSPVASRERNLPMTETLRSGLDVTTVRERFSSLRDFAFLDAPGGTQVPDEVGEAIARALREASANLGAGYATSRRVGAILEEAEHKAARFLGCDPREVIFGPNMTSLNFALSRTAGRGFQPGDEILVSSLDHDGGVAPWLELARDAGLVVRHVELHADTTLDFDDLERKLGPRTRVVAFAWASNAIGTVVDARRVCKLAHDAGALAWVDAVHYAAHEPIDVREVGADVLICAPYKFCGPHLGVACGRAAVLERWRPYKARPAP